MQIDYDHSIGKPTTPDEVDHLLRGQMKILGLAVDAIGREFPEVFDKIRRDCPAPADWEPCALDLKRDPDKMNLGKLIVRTQTCSMSSLRSQK